MIIWCDHAKDNNKSLVKRITQEAKNLAVEQPINIKEFVAMFLNNRGSLFDPAVATPTRIRVITNRARPEKEGSFNERAAQEIIEFLSQYSLTIPVLVYTSRSDKRDELNKEIMKRKPSIVCTTLPTAVIKYSKMSTLLWIERDLSAESNLILDHAQVIYFS
jgi:hypothetical protein